jgi:hypothetical protein
LWHAARHFSSDLFSLPHFLRFLFSTPLPSISVSLRRFLRFLFLYAASFDFCFSTPLPSISVSLRRFLRFLLLYTASFDFCFSALPPSIFSLRRLFLPSFHAPRTFMKRLNLRFFYNPDVTCQPAADCRVMIGVSLRREPDDRRWISPGGAFFTRMVSGSFLIAQPGKT